MVLVVTNSGFGVSDLIGTIGSSIRAREMVIFSRLQLQPYIPTNNLKFKVTIDLASIIKVANVGAACDVG